MLVFAFEEESDLERVVHSESWSYDKHLVTFQRVEADTSIAEMDCRWCSFWVQIHNLPVCRMNHDYAKVLGGVLGLVEQVAESEEERGREGCMRIRVKMDISKPLCRGRKARLSAGNETWIAFRYERLPNSVIGVACSRMGTETMRGGCRVKGRSDEKTNNMEHG